MAHSPAAADDLTRLREYIQPLQPLREAEWEAFSAGWTPLQVKRKTVLTAAGETERYLYFVLEGVQRIYHIGERGQEATLIFTYPSSFSGVVDSMLTQTTSTSFFESLTSSRLLRLDVRQLESLIRDHAGIRDLVLKTTAFALKGVLQRQAEWTLFSAEGKLNSPASAPKKNSKPCFAGARICFNWYLINTWLPTSALTPPLSASCWPACGYHKIMVYAKIFEKVDQ